MPNVILIVLDTTRIDHLGCYGYHRQTSPNIDELAKASLMYTRAIAPSSWTLPSHASLFTGKFTSSHGARYDPNGPFLLTDAINGPANWNRYRVRGLAENELTLAMILKQAGYTTGAVVAAIWLKKIFGLDKGFDYYDDSEFDTVNGRLAERVTASAVKWLEESRDKKFFLFLNYFDPHSPYRPPKAFAKAFLLDIIKRDFKKDPLEVKKALYDTEIRYMDSYVGQFLQKLKALDLYDESFIIVTSDHGELLGEHSKFYHGLSLYQEEIHIPLLLKYPNMEVSPSQTDTPVQLVDVFSMILERLGIRAPDSIQGNVPSKIEHPILSEVYPLVADSSEGDWRAIFKGDYKFIWRSTGHHLLFNLKNDPDEAHNLFEEEPKLVTHMSSELTQYIAKLPEPGPAAPVGVLDKDTKDALKSLGYVD